MKRRDLGRGVRTGGRHKIYTNPSQGMVCSACQTDGVQTRRLPGGLTSTTQPGFSTSSQVLEGHPKDRNPPGSSMDLCRRVEESFSVMGETRPSCGYCILGESADGRRNRPDRLESRCSQWHRGLYGGSQPAVAQSLHSMDPEAGTMDMNRTRLTWSPAFSGSMGSK